MSNFEIAIHRVLKDEGGFVDDRQDSGGATNFGISLRWLKSLPDLPKVFSCSDIGIETIQQLTREQAIFLYRHYFWDPYHYERILDQRIATKVFDFTVNAGSHASHTALQWALRASGHDKIPIDGILGEYTFKAVNGANAQVLLAAFRSEIAGYYRGLKNPHFESGWLARAYA